ncbi:hypothetical protein ACX0G9_16535 [Flavitalea flava]
MNTSLGIPFLFVLCLSAGIRASGQQEWPRVLTTSDGRSLRVYQPQADSLTDNILWFRAAFSLTDESKFGSFHAQAIIETDRSDRMVSFQKVNILSLHFSSNILSEIKAEEETLKAFLEREIARNPIRSSIDEWIGSLCMYPEQYKLYVYGELNYIPPRILITSKPSVLVMIDGVPQLKRYNEWGVKMVVNTPFTIAESEDGWFYLYGGRNWYIAPEAIGPYYPIAYMPSDMRKVQAAMDKANGTSPDFSREGGNLKTSNIVVSTEPAELVQTNGAPLFSPIAGTTLSYVSNSNNDIFLDTAQLRYYILLSGRWFSSSGLTGPWKFVAPDSLPADFARIPEGSAKSSVLFSVAGTDAALEAIIDARIPQTALVDRKTSPDTVIYDGAPDFSKIRGTNMQYAINTAAMVLKHRGSYYYVDRGIWFCGNSPLGPWEICVQRPDEVGKIPPDYPVYPCKFVYTYGAGQDSVFAGFTAGYLNAFTDGPTLVYGTGYYYMAWLKNNYYPRPTTWGFNMSYRSRLGWSLGHTYNLDWFNPGTAWGKGFGNGGWWGPVVYRPPYEETAAGGKALTSNSNSRKAIISADLICTDTAGTIYRGNKIAGWQKYDGNLWKKMDNQNPADKIVLETLDRQELFRNRARLRVLNK